MLVPPKWSRLLQAVSLAKNGLKAWQAALERGYEGIVTKDQESRYVPGRTLKWLKVKQKDYRKERRGVEFTLSSSRGPPIAHPSSAR